MGKSGRPPKKMMDKTIPVTLTLPIKHVMFIDECAKLLRISRSQFVNNIMQMGIDDARLMKKVGFFKVVGIAREIMEERESQIELPFTP